jgi:glycerol-1-phosphate dehydrogenase [NAD(P)+]
MKTIWPIPKIEMMSLAEVTESRRVALVYNGMAWKAVESKLHLPIVWCAEITEATVSTWNHQLVDFEGEILYSVGGGLAADAGKYMAGKIGIPMVCIPTALSVDAYLTWTSGIREGRGVRYIETKCPESLLVDFGVIGAAPASIRAAGICDVLSIATGNWDWHFAQDQGKNSPEMNFIPYVSEIAVAILDGALECASAAGRGDPGGLKQLLDCIAMEVQLTNQIGHARPEEGSEHYFAYAVENYVGYGKPHADLLGPGILMMAAVQGQDLDQLRQAMDDCHIPLHNISAEVVNRTLHELPEYCHMQGLPYGIAHQLTDEMMVKAQKIFSMQ